MEWTREENEYDRAVRGDEPARRHPPLHARAGRRRHRRRARRVAGWMAALAVLSGMAAAVIVFRQERTFFAPTPERQEAATVSPSAPAAWEAVAYTAEPVSSPEAAEEAVRAIEAYALLHGYTLDDYPEAMIRLYEKNAEARDFVLHYPAEHDREHDRSLTLDGSVPLYLQWDERWGYESYSGEYIAVAGCGPCCLAMAASYLLQDAAYDPLTVARWSEEQGYAVPGEGTAWSLFSEGAELLGLDCVEIGADEQRVADNLAVGNVIVCVVGPGDFTEEGHFILLTQYSDGYVTVHDPNSAKRSAQSWRFADISDQMLSLWVLR